MAVNEPGWILKAPDAEKRNKNGVKAVMTTKDHKKHKKKLYTINTLINLLKINLKIH
jgi:hypothetical protein